MVPWDGFLKYSRPSPKHTERKYVGHLLYVVFHDLLLIGMAETPVPSLFRATFDQLCKSVDWAGSGPMFMLIWMPDDMVSLWHLD